MLEANFLLFGLSLLSGLYWLWALACAVAFGHRHPSRRRFSPPVTVLKPLCGNDGYLYENLRSFCEQAYPRYQLVFGVRDHDDPAVRVVNRLMQEFPDLDVTLVVSDHSIGNNPKISNLSNLYGRAKYDTLVLADSDMRVGPDYLSVIVAPLEDRSVGLVTCLYKGTAPTGLWSTLGAMFINEWFFPSALVGARLGLLRYAFGATIACRRDTLASVGGFEALADYLADDYMLGWLVSHLGSRVVLAPYVVENVVVEKDLKTLFFHELRWTRTFRTVRPVQYFLSIVTYGIPLSLLFLLSSGMSQLALATVGSHLVLRYVCRTILYQTLRPSLGSSSAWLVPVRDVLTFVLWLLSFLGGSIRWNRYRFRVRADGRLHLGTAVRIERSAGRPSEPVPLGQKQEG